MKDESQPDLWSEEEIALQQEGLRQLKRATGWSDEAVAADMTDVTGVCFHKESVRRHLKDEQRFSTERLNAAQRYLAVRNVAEARRVARAKLARLLATFMREDLPAQQLPSATLLTGRYLARHPIYGERLLDVVGDEQGRVSGTEFFTRRGAPELAHGTGAVSVLGGLTLVFRNANNPWERYEYVQFGASAELWAGTPVRRLVFARSDQPIEITDAANAAKEIFAQLEDRMIEFERIDDAEAPTPAHTPRGMDEAAHAAAACL